MKIVNQKNIEELRYKKEKSHRLFCSVILLIGAFVHFGWGVAYRYMYPEVNDPLLVRGIWSILALVGLYLVHSEKLSVKVSWRLVFALVAWVNIYVTWVGGNAANSFAYVVGWTYTMSITGLLFPRMAYGLALFVIDLIAMCYFLLGVPGSHLEDGMILVLFTAYSSSTLGILYARLHLMNGLSKQNEEIVHQSEIIEQERAKSFNASKVASLSEMSSGVAHEINNPLTIISLSNNKILKSGVLPDDLVKYCVKINKTIARISHIVNSLKFLSDTKENSKVKEVGPEELIQRATDLLQERFNSAGIRVSIRSELAGYKVRGNPLELSQVIFTLINNAVDALETKDGDKIINISGEDVEDKIINISVEEIKDNISFRIEDNADRIPDQVVEKLFTPFFTTKGVGIGIGLGLSTSLAIAEAHNGTLKLHQYENQKYFELLLPKVRATLGYEKSPKDLNKKAS